MRIEGQITNIQPDGGYNSHNGYIFTFQMAIQASSGAYCGQIGAKTEIYPLQVGQPILVEATQDQHGWKFKKINPQYQNQNQNQVQQRQQGPPASPPQNAQPTYQPVPQDKPRDYDRENHGKCFTVLCEGVLQSGIAPMSLKADPDSLTAIADLATACMNSYDYRSPESNDPSYQSHEPEDIPWEQG